MNKKLKIETILALSIIICAMVIAIGPATKPVQAATVPIFGNTAIGTHFDQNDANAQSVSYFTSTTAGSVTDIIAYIAGSSSGNAIAALYTVTGGSAQILIAQSKAVNIGTSFSWIDFQLPASYSIIAGTTYGLAIMGNVQLNIMEGGSGQRDHNVAISFANGFANPFGPIWGTDSIGAMSIYAASSDKSTKLIGALSEVNLQLPSNSSPPALSAGTPNHPVTMKIAAWDLDQSSTNGPADELLIFIWQPVKNAYANVAVITDNAANAELWKAAWNNTNVWYPVGPPTFPPNFNLFPNVITVAPKDLEVWTESGNNLNDASNTLWVNLTKAVTITLPYFNATGSNSNQTFTLPQMTLMFKATSGAFDDPFVAPFVGYPGASNYTLTRSGSSEFADARVNIPDWLGNSFRYEATGHVYWHVTDTITPP